MRHVIVLEATIEGSSEVNLLKQICKEIKLRGRLDENLLARPISIFGSRFMRALEALKERRVKKYVFQPSGRVVWIVVGKERDYLILPNVYFCSCNDFYFRALDHQLRFCYHIIAQRIAEELSLYDIIEDSDDFYEILMKEWKEPIKESAFSE